MLWCQVWLGQLPLLHQYKLQTFSGSSKFHRYSKCSICLSPSSLIIVFKTYITTLNILQISFFSTSPELSNKQRFEYFSRTIPSDHFQTLAMAELVKLFGWKYISVVYEESSYGQKVTITIYILYILKCPNESNLGI